MAYHIRNDFRSIWIIVILILCREHDPVCGNVAYVANPKVVWDVFLTEGVASQKVTRLTGSPNRVRFPAPPRSIRRGLPIGSDYEDILRTHEPKDINYYTVLRERGYDLQKLDDVFGRIIDVDVLVKQINYFMDMDDYPTVKLLLVQNPRVLPLDQGVLLLKDASARIGITFDSDQYTKEAQEQYFLRMKLVVEGLKAHGIDLLAHGAPRGDRLLKRTVKRLGKPDVLSVRLKEPLVVNTQEKAEINKNFTEAVDKQDVVMACQYMRKKTNLIDMNYQLAEKYLALEDYIKSNEAPPKNQKLLKWLWLITNREPRVKVKVGEPFHDPAVIEKYMAKVEVNQTNETQEAWLEYWRNRRLHLNPKEYFDMSQSESVDAIFEPQAELKEFEENVAIRKKLRTRHPRRDLLFAGAEQPVEENRKLSIGERWARVQTWAISRTENKERIRAQRMTRTRHRKYQTYLAKQKAQAEKKNLEAARLVENQAKKRRRIRKMFQKWKLKIRRRKSESAGSTKKKDKEQTVDHQARVHLSVT